MWLSGLTEQQRVALLGLAHDVVVSDGILDPNEELMLDEFKREMTLNPDTQSEYLDLHGIEKIFDSNRSRIIAMLNLLRISYVDGAFEVEEECLLKEVSRIFALSPEQFMLLENWVKRLISLEEEAVNLMK